ncbi:transcription initiation factor TFIID subunit 4-like [Hippocampus comes]|uniref:transcription initiation factor TFIID subunit 4-like n=1 Tax=Hippocampus comes TaxID=109280 RepID=UPI00094E7417|nr:PREDICTED: transcription initiation factor TFIID subunit 4-like [Hippocampus comes]
MAGASDPLEDMLFNEVDEKAVSDLVGSLESQLGEAEGPAYSAGKREGAQAAATHFSGKVREQEPQQGHPGAALKLQPPAAQLLPSYSSTSGGGSAAPVSGGAGPGPETFGPAASSSPVRAPAVQTLSAQPAAAVSFQRAAEASGRTASPGLQSLNGTAGAVKLLSSAASTTTTTTTSTITTTTTGAAVTATATATTTMV